MNASGFSMVRSSGGKISHGLFGWKYLYFPAILNFRGSKYWILDNISHFF
jgi:hypothetical protein